MRKTLKSISAIFVIILIVYSLLITLIPFYKPASSWLIFGFTLFAFCACFGVFLYSFKKESTFASKIYDIPIFKVAVLYVIGQISLSFVFYIIGAFVLIPIWLTLLVCFIFLAAAVVGFIATNNAKEIVLDIENQTIQKTVFISTFQLSLEDIADFCQGEAIKRAMDELIEEVRYSDPVSSSATEGIEKQLLEKVGTLKECICSVSEKDVLEEIAGIDCLLKSRNRICRQNKRC